MIRVHRERVPVPAVLRDARRDGPREAERVRRSLRKWCEDGKAPSAWTFAFAAYRHTEIKAALAALFHGKCAYCESSYSATQPMDVEHWRPKGQIEDAAGPIRPAYHWLAASWENLLPSCIDCNRRRIQRDALTGTDRAIGKQDQFPLDSSSVRATSAAQLDGEVPLLLNPCCDNPETFLECTDEGLIIPLAADGLHQRRARASIDVYALNRSGLVLARKQLVRQIRLRIARVTRITRLLEDPGLPDPVALVLDELLVGDLRELARMRRDDHPYALLARRLIDRWMNELTTHGIAPGALATPTFPGRAE